MEINPEDISIIMIDSQFTDPRTSITYPISIASCGMCGHTGFMVCRVKVVDKDHDHMLCLKCKTCFCDGTCHIEEGTN